MQPDARIDRYYQILGVNRATPLSQIQDAHKSLIKEWHPDRFDLNDPRREEAEQRAMDINNAFQQIKRIRTAGLGYTKFRSRNTKSAKPQRSDRKTVESKIVVRDGKVVSIKRKKKIRSDGESSKSTSKAKKGSRRRSSSKRAIREVLISARSIGQAVAKAAADAAEAARQPQVNGDKLVVHIVEGQKTIRVV